jgi:hypothetical protein
MSDINKKKKKEKKTGEDKKLEVNDGYFVAPKFIFNIPKTNGAEEGKK